MDLSFNSRYCIIICVVITLIKSYYFLTLVLGMQKYAMCVCVVILGFRKLQSFVKS